MQDGKDKDRVLAQLNRLKAQAAALDEADQDSSVAWAQVEHLMEESGLTEQPPED